MILPSRNNLEYLIWAYNAIRKNISDEIFICVADDASTDGTWNWLNKTKKTDRFLKIMRNDGPERLGHCILYDTIIKNLVSTEIAIITHADMYWLPGAIDNMLKHLLPKTIVSATRIEPPLHPPGVEKVIFDMGYEPSQFHECEILDFNNKLQKENYNKISNGIFAPWMFYVNDFVDIGGHDKLFAPMELEDSDIFNRMYLNKYVFIQSRDSYVAHLTCRGSRFKDGIEIEKIIDLPDGTKWYKPKDSEEYTTLRNIKFREWWRKWGQNVLHDSNMLPIVHPKYNIGFVVKNCTLDGLKNLEPWCDRIHVDLNWDAVKQVYIRNEQPNTLFDLYDRIYPIDNDIDTDIIVEMDLKKFSIDDYKNIMMLSEIIKDNGEIGNFELLNLKIQINRLTEYQDSLIKCNNNVFI